MDQTPLCVVAHGVGTVTINRPEKLNPLTPDELSAIFGHIERLSADPQVRVIILTGAGRAFCTGVDLAIVRNGPPREVITPISGIRPQWGDEIGPALNADFRGGWGVMIKSRKPIIAAINGPAIGWGLVLALHCDIRIAARSASLGAPFARLGLPAEKASGWLLTRLVGTARAADLLFSGRMLNAPEAAAMGLINEIVDDADLGDHVQAYARRLAESAAPRALAAMKAQIWSALDSSYAEAFRASGEEERKGAVSQDGREGLASYLERRKPVFSGT